MNIRLHKKIISLVIPIALAFGCQKLPTSLEDTNTKSQSGLPSSTDPDLVSHQYYTGENGSIDNSNTGSDGGLIGHFRPALAVRATGCIMCHAKVASNIITDFGRGDSYFFGTPEGGISNFSGAIYGNHSENWSSAQVWGTVYVPPTNAPSAAFNGTLANYLRGIVTAPDATTPPPPIVEKANLYIGAPTAQTMLTAAGTMPSAHPSWKYVAAGTSLPTISGIEVVSGAGGNFVRNIVSGEVICDGDLFVDAVLFLNNVTVRTDNGCRIYTTKSAFIQGPVLYSGVSPNRNLQLSSARAIVLGMGRGPVNIMGNNVLDSIQFRLHDFWTDIGFHTRDTSLPTQGILDLTIADSQLLGADLIDAALQPTGRAVAFERLLLNAPNVQSRYQGEFDGVIVAEMAIWSLSTFKFQFDDVFSRVPILPKVSASTFLMLDK